MKLISFEDIRRLGIDLADCLNWVEEGLLNKDGAQLPPKMSLQPTGTPDGTFVNTMFCGLYRQGRDLGKLRKVLELLVRQAELPQSYRDHALEGSHSELLGL